MFRRAGGDSQTERGFYDEHSWLHLTVILSNGITGFVIDNVEGHELAYQSGLFEYRFVDNAGRYYDRRVALIGPPQKPLDLVRLKAMLHQAFQDSEVPDYYRNYIMRKLDEYGA